MTRAYVGLGANLGDRAAMLRAAVEQLAAEPGIEVVAVSPVRETEPVGFTDQPLFLNAAAAVETELPPRELLDRLLGIERRLGRTRDGPRFGPRTIDLDLLLYGDERSTSLASRCRIPGCTSGCSRSSPCELDPQLDVPGRGPLTDRRGLQSG